MKWPELAQHWSIRPDTIYLNHGSFGPSPVEVLQAKRNWQDKLDSQPMDFFVRQSEAAWLAARHALAEFIHTHEDNLIFVENATAGMNIIARSVALSENDVVALTDHEYGAVQRIWTAKCQTSRAQMKTLQLPTRIESADQIVKAILQQWDERIRIFIVSHITSATAIHLPVADILSAIRAAFPQTLTIVDGPHAPLHVDVNLDQLGCDFYTASCHKWLCAPLGSGFLFVHPHHQHQIVPTQLSWGRLLPALPERWFEQFMWSGTRDSSAYYSVATAIEFFQQWKIDQVRQYMFALADETTQRLLHLLQTDTIAPPNSAWYGAMSHVRLPVADAANLQARLWNGYGIEVPIVHWGERWFVRVSNHVYNDSDQVTRLIDALRTELDLTRS